jgi:hypothetical protein
MALKRENASLKQSLSDLGDAFKTLDSCSRKDRIEILLQAVSSPNPLQVVQGILQNAHGNHRWLSERKTAQAVSACAESDIEFELKVSYPAAYPSTLVNEIRDDRATNLLPLDSISTYVLFYTQSFMTVLIILTFFD